MTKYRISKTEEKAVKHEGWRYSALEPLLQVEDCEGYRYRYELEAQSDYYTEYYEELFDNLADAHSFIEKNLISVINFRDSWKHGKNFDNEISLSSYSVEEVKRDDIDDEWEFVEDCGGFYDKIVCIHDSRKYVVIDNETKTTTEFNYYDDAENFAEDLNDYTIVLKLFVNGELDEEIELNY